MPMVPLPLMYCGKVHTYLPIYPRCYFVYRETSIYERLLFFHAGEQERQLCSASQAHYILTTARGSLIFPRAPYPLAMLHVTGAM